MRKVQNYLGSDGVLRRLTREAQRLADLERAYRRVVPSALAEASGVDHTDGATLFLWANGGAVAAKLRQLAPMVLTRIGTLAPECTAIRVVVRIDRGDDGRSLPRRPSIGEQGVAALRGLAQMLPPSSLKTALARLAARGAKRSEDGK